LVFFFSFFGAPVVFGSGHLAVKAVIAVADVGSVVEVDIGQPPGAVVLVVRRLAGCGFAGEAAVGVVGVLGISGG